MSEQLEVSDFQWASASEYFRHIEVQAGLIEFDLSAVFSYHIRPEDGARGLMRRKQSLLSILHENLKRIKDWVVANDGNLGSKELALVRSLFRTTRDLAVMTDGHLVRAADLAAWHQSNFDFMCIEKEASDDLPF